jgi:acyl-CoA synthetase (AMP-forming)/AMP-acid ligase II
MAKYDLARFLLYLDTYRITFLSAVPVILNMLAKHPRPGDFNLRSIESVTSGSAPLNPATGAAVARMYLRPGVTVKQGLGMTECTCSLSGFAADDADDGRSVGWLNANCQVRVVPVEGEDFTASSSSSGEGKDKDDIPAGVVVGELWIAGPNVMKGYYRQPGKTGETIVHDVQGTRWLRTGDIGYVDGRGRIYVVDRMKELIKVKGLQVSPAELELALLEHAGVADAAVVGAKMYVFPCSRLSL